MGRSVMPLKLPDHRWKGLKKEAKEDEARRAHEAAHIA